MARNRRYDHLLPEFGHSYLALISNLVLQFRHILPLMGIL
jgi:hypothetical protein